jgi:hypothetical protein
VVLQQIILCSYVFSLDQAGIDIVGTLYLFEQGFLHVGSWITSKSRPHRAEWIAYQPGIYAFVIGDSVMYLGRTAFLSRRLRSYSRLAFTQSGGEPRDVYRKIAVCVEQGTEVMVFAKVVPNASIDRLDALLGPLVADIDPIWNTLPQTMSQ